MKLFQLSKANAYQNLPLAADDLLLLRQDACYLLRDQQFCQQYQQQLRVLAQDAAERLPQSADPRWLDDLAWVALCAEAEVVITWN